MLHCKELDEIMWPVSDPLIMIKEQEMLRLHKPYGMCLNLDYLHK